jgi:predicted RND superfamily exporter protein
MARQKNRVLKILSFFVILMVTGISEWSAKRALHIPMTYSPDQFLPKDNELILHDKKNKKIFQLSAFSPQIIVISQKRVTQNFLHGDGLARLQALTHEIEALPEVDQVMALGNVEAALSKDKELMFGTLADLKAAGLSRTKILSNPMFVPTLLSENAMDTAIFVMPKQNSLHIQANLSNKLIALTTQHFPNSTVRIGGPAPIRAELLNLLSKEVLFFLALSLIAALVVLKLLFHGWSILWQVILILTASNLISLGMMSLLNFSFNMLSSTLTILVTVCSLGIVTRTLVRMGKIPRGPNQKEALLALLKELWLPHMLAAFTTAVGFATLIPSEVPLISQYGLGVTVGVSAGALITLLMMPAMLLWTPWPTPRSWLGNRRDFAFWMLKHGFAINLSVAVLIVVFFGIGTQLSWTSRLYDDLPSQHAARRTTDFIGRHLGGQEMVRKSQGRKPYHIVRFYECWDRSHFS